MTALSGITTTHVELMVPIFGGWTADVTLEAGKAGLAGRCSLTVGDLTLAGSVVRGGVSEGTSTWRGYLAGGAGWDTALAVRPGYQSDAPGGVRLRTVLQDLATECGETLRLPADAPIGSAYARPGSVRGRPYRGRDALAALQARGLIPGWWVDPTGTTRFDARPGGAAKVPEVLDRNLARAIRKLGAVASVAGLVPGRTVEGSTVRRLYVVETAEETRAEVWS